jgi:GAF domain-containing protein
VSGREREVSAAFVALASDLANGRDATDMLSELTSSCAQLLDIESAGLLLADTHLRLHVMASSSEATRELEVFQVQVDEGPCLDCYRDGTPVSVPDLREARERWPTFVDIALGHGFRSVHAVPLRLRNNFLGALGMFGAQPGTLNEDDLHLGQALADVASVALVQERATADASALAEQLQRALVSRVVIEQAKGVLSQYANTDMETAFAVLRTYVRDRNLRLAEIARGVVTRELDARALIEHAVATGVLK